MLYGILGFVIYVLGLFAGSYIRGRYTSNVGSWDLGEFLLVMFWPLSPIVIIPIALVVGITFVCELIEESAQEKRHLVEHAKRAKERMKQDIEDRAFFEGDEEPNARAGNGVRLPPTQRPAFVGNTWD